MATVQKWRLYKYGDCTKMAKKSTKMAVQKWKTKMGEQKWGNNTVKIIM